MILNKFGASNPTGSAMNEEFFKNMSDAGILMTEVAFAWDHYSDLNWEDLKKYSSKYGVELWSFHLPFMPFDEICISSTIKAYCESSVNYLIELMKQASEVGIDKVVLHTSGEPIMDAQRYEKTERAKESLDRMAEVAKTLGQVIAVENLPRTCLGKNSTEILELISANDKLRVCYDTNHLMGEDYSDFIANVGDKIITTHFSDYDFADERHWLPGDGKNDWAGIMKALQSVGYSGPIIYEVSLKQRVNPVREMVKYEDYKKNFDWLISLL